jgi:GNAT superfamily N-acetyltransferase
MIIRDARPTDMVAIKRLIGQLADEPDAAEFRRRFERVSSDSDHRIIVAEVAGRWSACCMSSSAPPLEKPARPWCRRWWSTARAPRAACGAALMHEAEAWAAGRSLSSSALYTRIDRDWARAFYERIGYREKDDVRLMGRDLA